MDMILKITLNFLFLCSAFMLFYPNFMLQMRLTLLCWTPLLHSLRPFFAPTMHLLRAYYSPTMLHECSSPCNYCFLALYLSCVYVPFSYALKDPYLLPSAWLHLAPRWLPTWFQSAMGIRVGEGSGTLLLHCPIPIRMLVLVVAPGRRLAINSRLHAFVRCC
jgi:hypothetical protein